MWWSITTTSATPKSLRAGVLSIAVVTATVTGWAQVQDVRAPATVAAGQEAVVSTAGSGDATFYLVGPGRVIRRQVRLGQEIRLQPSQLRAAGRYVAVACADSCRHTEFYVLPGRVASLSFLVHPSRAAVGQQGVLSGVVLPFDQYRNLVLDSIPVDFELKVNAQDMGSRTITTQNGVAWFRANSGSHAGAVQLVASVGDVSVRRVIQQVASDPCNLRVKAERNAGIIQAETEAVRDCAGNPVPDGTIVTFHETSAAGTSTVDAPVKQGVARAQMLAAGPAVITVASGVVMGNEVRLQGQR